VETEKKKSTRSGKVKEKKRIVTSLHWSVKKDTEINSRSGVYFLLSSLKESENILWQTYHTIREIEYTNRVPKTDLDLRPIYHKKDETSLATSAFGIVSLLNSEYDSFLTQESGKGYKQRPHPLAVEEIVRIMNSQKAVTTLAQNSSDEVIQIRRCTYPDQKA
jgi:hypothetical protein